MPRVLKNLLHRPALRFDAAAGGRGRRRGRYLASFVAHSNRKALNTTFHDVLLRCRRLLRQAVVASLAIGGAWVVVESARAFSVF